MLVVQSSPDASVCGWSCVVRRQRGRPDSWLISVPERGKHGVSVSGNVSFSSASRRPASCRSTSFQLC